MTNTQALQFTLGERLVKIRRENGRLTQQQTADLLGVGKRNLVRYENDELDPPLELLRRYRRVFGTPLSWLIEGESATVTASANEGYLPDYLVALPFAA